MQQPLTIGIVGGMSPESTAIYYEHIVRRHQLEFHNHAYPPIIITSVSFQQYIEWQHQEAWQKIAKGLEQEFGRLAAAGADFAVLATNTMHKVLPSIKTSIPVLSILDIVADYCRRNAVATIALTGTRFTMSDGFYSQGLESQGLKVIIPSTTQQDQIHRIIYEELIAGVVKRESIEAFAKIGQDLTACGAQAVLLGCTELVMLVENPTELNTIDSTRLHAEAAWRRAVAGKDSEVSFCQQLFG
jgi:aspartate racemase